MTDPLTRQVLTSPTDRASFAVVDPASEEAQWAMASYFEELDRRFAHGFDPGDGLATAAEAFSAPNGSFVVARCADTTVGCGAIQFIDGEVAEVKRMWIAPAARGTGLGRRLLAELERRIRAAGRGIVVLDTNSSLLEAIAMYRACGYVDIDRYVENPYAELWFRKDLRALPPTAPD